MCLKKSSTSDLQNSEKYYQFTFRPKKSNLMENLKANAFLSINMSDLQILTTFPRSGKWKVLEKNLCSPLAFPMSVNIKPYQKYTKNRENAVFNFFHPNLVYYQYYKNVPWPLYISTKTNFNYCKFQSSSSYLLCLLWNWVNLSLTGVSGQQLSAIKRTLEGLNVSINLVLFPCRIEN